MRRTRLLHRAVTVLAVAAAAVAVPTAAFADPPAKLIPFHADSGGCLSGSTNGDLTWDVTSPSIAVSGVVDDGGGICANPVDDGLFTVATFSAYSAAGVVDTQRERVDNNQLKFTFGLGYEPPVPGSAVTPPAIERVVVQVCRYPLLPAGGSSAGTCGKSQTYTYSGLVSP